MFAVLVSGMILLHFSLSRRDEQPVSTSRSRTQNRKRHASSSSRSRSNSPRHRRRRVSPVEEIWVPAETSKSHLSHLVGSSKFNTTRSYDDSRVNPERKPNLSDDTAGEVFGPTLPPSKEAEKQSSEPDHRLDTGNQETKSRQCQTSKDGQNSLSASKKVSRTDERRHSSHKQKNTKSRETSSTSSSSRKSSRSQSSSSSTSSSPASKSKKKLPQTKSRSSVSVSGPRRTRKSRSSSRSSSGTKTGRKRVRRSTSSSSRSSGNNYRSKPRSKASTDPRSRKDRFEAQSDRRRDRQCSRRDSYAGRERSRQRAEGRTNLSSSFSGRRKSRSNSGSRSKKDIPIQQANRSSRKGESFDQRSRKTSERKESGPAAKSNVAKDTRAETRGKPLTNYSSSSSDDNKRRKTPCNISGVASIASTADRKVLDSKKPTTSSRRNDTAVTVIGDGGKNANSDQTKTDDKPKETLEDMELFLKQLKANKQQMLKKQ